MLADELGVDVLQVCQDIYGIEGSLVIDEYNILCPNPRHQDTHPSCNVNVTTGMWHCYACDDRGDIVSLGVRVLGKPYLKVRKLLMPDGPEAVRNMLRNRLRGLQKPSGAVVAAPRWDGRPESRVWLPEPLQSRDAYRGRAADLEAYMHDRGLTDATLARWGVRYVRVAEVSTKRRTAEIRNSVAIPLLDANGVVVAWTYRATPSSLAWQPKYLDTKDAPVGEVWHGMHLVGTSSEVVVVEGPLDAMWVDQCGFPVLSMMGSMAPEAKVMQLLNFRKVTLLFDDDVAGRLTTRKMGELLWRHIPVLVGHYPSFSQGTDPNELAPVDVELALACAEPFSGWKMKRKLASAGKVR